MSSNIIDLLQNEYHNFLLKFSNFLIEPALNNFLFQFWNPLKFILVKSEIKYTIVINNPEHSEFSNIILDDSHECRIIDDFLIIIEYMEKYNQIYMFNMKTHEMCVYIDKSLEFQITNKNIIILNENLICMLEENNIFVWSFKQEFKFLHKLKRNFFVWCKIQIEPQLLQEKSEFFDKYDTVDGCPSPSLLNNTVLIDTFLFFVDKTFNILHTYKILENSIIKLIVSSFFSNVRIMKASQDKTKLFFSKNKTLYLYDIYFGTIHIICSFDLHIINFYPNKSNQIIIVTSNDFYHSFVFHKYDIETGELNIYSPSSSSQIVEHKYLNLIDGIWE